MIQDIRVLEPPPTNRGLNLQIGQDWFTWTNTFQDLPHLTALANLFAEEFGDRFDWSESRGMKYGQWYQNAFASILGIRLGYNLLDDGRVEAIFVVSGSIINSIPQRKWLRFQSFTLYPLGGFCTRLDMFADDDTGVIAAVRENILNHCQLDKPELISGFRKYEVIRSGSVGGLTLQTLYMGSRMSNRYVRIYDKIKEREEREEKKERNGEKENERNGEKENERKEMSNREKRREEFRKKRREEKRREREERERENSRDKTIAHNVPLCCDTFQRWELESKSEQANSIFELICKWYQQHCSEENIIEVLQGFMRDIIFSGYQFYSQRLNASKDRRNIVCDWWEQFLMLIDHAQFKLPTVRPVRTIERVAGFLQRQAATSLALMRRYLGVGFSDWLDSLYQSGEERLTDAQLLMLELKLENS